MKAPMQAALLLATLAGALLAPAAMARECDKEPATYCDDGWVWDERIHACIPAPPQADEAPAG